MPTPIGLQLYSLRKAIEADGYEKVFKQLADIGYQYVETAGLYNKTAKEIGRALDACGLHPISAHLPLFDSSKHAQIEDDARTLGYKHLVAGFGTKDFESEDKIRACADKVNEACNYFLPKGFTVSLHNHWWEFDRPRTGELLFELAPKCTLELDIYWVTSAGASPVDVIRRYGRRVKLLHIKDGPAKQQLRGPQDMTAVGQGNVDIAGAVREGEKAAVEYLIVELDNCATDMLQAVRDSYNYLVGHGLGSGRK